MRQVLWQHGVDHAEVDRVFGAVDMDRSGRLHYMEFLAATVEAMGYIQVLSYFAHPEHEEAVAEGDIV